MKAPDSQIAVTLYNLRDYCKTESDLDKTLDKVCDIGYRAVQVSGTPLPADVIRKQLDSHNLYCCATHEGLDTLKGDPAALIDRLQTLECDFTALGAPPPEYRQDVKMVDELIRIFETMGGKLREKESVSATITTISSSSGCPAPGRSCSTTSMRTAIRSLWRPRSTFTGSRAAARIP